MKTTEAQLSSAQTNYNYFQSVFKVIGKPDKNEYLICYDYIPATSLSILPCSHLYCYDCVKGTIEKTKSRFLDADSEYFFNCNRMSTKRTEIIPEDLENHDSSMYSSKLMSLYRYITDLIRIDHGARIILFLQYRDLTDFIAKNLKELGVEYVRVSGNIFERQNAINKFRDSKNVRLIMMSSEDSVSGINLTQATHVILLHPFYTGAGEKTDLAYEKQGISRAYRFGLNHPLKVVRFAAIGTIEETITSRRENISLSS